MAIWIDANGIKPYVTAAVTVLVCLLCITVVVASVVICAVSLGDLIWVIVPSRQ